MPRHVILAGLAATALLALSACGSSGFLDAGTATDTRDFAGLWDASTTLPDGKRDERYVSISADGRYTEYDYRQDDVADDGNCYLVTALRLQAIGARDMLLYDDEDETDGALTDADPFYLVGAPTYRLSDGRTVSWFLDAGEIRFSGSLDGTVTTLISGFGPTGTMNPAVFWSLVEGQAIEDLEPCEGV